MVSKGDLDIMYSQCEASDIIIWCDGRETWPKRKKETEDSSTNRQEKEEEVDEVIKTLQQKHGNCYDIPRQRLWSRMICSNIHDDTDTPPAYQHSHLQVLLRKQGRIHLLMP